jgi:hypothetical protein
MCPICLATALAAWSGLVAVGVLSVAWADRLSRLLGVMLGIEIAAHRWGIWTIPWWCFASVMAAALVRIAYVISLHPERLLISKIWPRACQVAANRCFRYRSANQHSSRMSTAIRQRDDPSQDNIRVPSTA